MIYWMSTTCFGFNNFIRVTCKFNWAIFKINFDAAYIKEFFCFPKSRFFHRWLINISSYNFSYSQKYLIEIITNIWMCVFIFFLKNQMARGCWWYYFSKFTEFFDTIFFVMRKRYDQVSTLHVIHHGIMPVSVWWGVKFTPGTLTLFFLKKSLIIQCTPLLLYAIDIFETF